MLFKLIACNVFLREASLAIADSPHRVDPEFLELGEHMRPDQLRQSLQDRICACDESAKPYDAIVLLYGLCGNSTVGLQAGGRRLVMPRAHDCCTILLGSTQRFQEHFGDNPSRPFSSIGYLERGEYFVRTDQGDGQIHYGDRYAALVEQYGEDNARYIWESMHCSGAEDGEEVTFIEIAETAALGAKRQFEEKAAEEGKTCRYVDGSLQMIRNLIHGNWDSSEFLIAEPGEQIAGVYDWDEVVRAKPRDASRAKSPAE